MKPISGILTQREYLNCLAFRIFPSTQYIRHSLNPFYTPEPDILHEYMGHAVMFANPLICDISQKMGLLSLGASDY
jgi:phenylalanine-4-hydroxylase